MQMKFHDPPPEQVVQCSSNTRQRKQEWRQTVSYLLEPFYPNIIQIIYRAH